MKRPDSDEILKSVLMQKVLKEPITDIEIVMPQGESLCTKTVTMYRTKAPEEDDEDEEKWDSYEKAVSYTASELEKKEEEAHATAAQAQTEQK